MGTFSKRLGRRGPAATVADAEDTLVGAARAFIRRPDGAVALRLASGAAELLDARGAASAGAAQRACGPGCAYCCHYPVTLSLAEALRIVDHLAGQSAAVQAAIRAAVIAADEAAADEDDEALFLSRRACAFLGEDSRCRIYAVRPLACRGHAAMDRQACADAHAAPGDPARADRVVVDDDLRREKDRVKTTLALTLRAAGRDLLEYELHALMRLLLADPRRARAWLSGQVTEQPCRVLAVSRAAHAEIHRLADEA